MIEIPNKKKSRMMRIKEKTEKVKLKYEELRQITEPIMRLVENQHKIIDLAVAGGLAYYGFHVNRHWTGALTGLLGYQLAKQESLISSGAGITILASLGVLNLWQTVAT